MEQEAKVTANKHQDAGPTFDEVGSAALDFEDNVSFHNVFAGDNKKEKTEPYKQIKTDHHYSAQDDNKGAAKYREERLPKQAMPKMDFPDFDGSDPKVWLDNCRDYFDLYQIPEGMWITAARLHLKGNAARWYQAFKQKNAFKSWTHFCHVIQQEFGSDDFRSSMTDLLEIKQTGLVEDYTTQFQALQYAVTMHNANYDEMFFTQHYVKGLKEEIRGMVEAQMPTTVLKASTLAKVQQKVIDRGKTKYTRAPYQARTPHYNRLDTKIQTSNLWNDRQLRDYRKANGLCFHCGEKFIPGHLEVCTKRNKPKLNALAINDLDRELTDEVLNDLAAEDALHEEFCQLSLNAISTRDKADCIKLRTRVKDKTMLILIDSGSTHSFISTQFV